MKPKFKFFSKEKRKKSIKSYSFSSLFNYFEEEIGNDHINKFLSRKDLEYNLKNDKNNDINNQNESIKKINTSNIIIEKNINEKQNINSVIVNKSIQKSHSKQNNDSKKKTKNFHIAFVEIKSEENFKNENILLTEPIKKKKKINKLSDGENNFFFKNNKIIYNFYTDYMRRKKQKELVESKLFKQKLIDQLVKYSPNYMKKIVAKIEFNAQKEIRDLEKLKEENKLRVYNSFKDKIKRRLIEGEYYSENENSNMFINSIYGYLYKNIMNYDHLIYLLNKYKGKISTNFGKMISEFLSLRFDCFKNIKKTFGGPLKLIKLCELLKLEKYKKGDIIYDIDNYENKYFLLLKGNIDVYKRDFIKENMKIGEFINYLKDIKFKENNFFKLNRIIQKNIKEKTFDKFELLEEYEYNILSIKNHLEISDKKELFIEVNNLIDYKTEGDNINNSYIKDNNLIYNKKINFPKNSSLEFVNEFFKNEDNIKYFQMNYSDKKYICTEECFLVSIEKDIFEKKNKELDIKLFGESAEMFSLYTFIFKTWKSQLINLFLKKYAIKRSLIQGEYLYNQNEKSEKMYIITKGVFNQTISLNTKRINEVKNYILFNKKNNIFIYYQKKKKKIMNYEEIENYLASNERENGNFPYEIPIKKYEIKKEEKKNNVFHTLKKYNNKFYVKKNKEENEINDINNFIIKKSYKFEVLGIEDAIERKHRFSKVECQSKKGEILEIKIVDFINFCILRKINITYLKEIITKIKDILIQKIEKIIQVNQNNLRNDINYQDKEKENNKINEIKNKSNLVINKNSGKKSYIEENDFDPLEIALHTLRKYKNNKLKEKYEIVNSSLRKSNNKIINRSYKKKNNLENIFFDYLKDEYAKTERNNKINNLYLYNKEEEKELNNTNENYKNYENNFINKTKENKLQKNNANIFTKSAHNLKKKFFFENLKINKNSYSVKKNKNIKVNERRLIRRKYLEAKKKLEESYFRREKYYYMKNFHNFPFIKYIYGKKKKDDLNTEQYLYSNRNKYLEKEEELNKFLKKLNSKNKDILFSKIITREAGYYSKNNSYRKLKISTRNIGDNNNKKSSYCKTEHKEGNNNYDSDVFFLKHIDFGKIRKIHIEKSK